MLFSRCKAFVSRLRASFSSARSEDETQAELAAHLALLAERFERQGMSAEEARCAARRQFGGVTRVSGELRRRRVLPFEDFLRDMRFAFRQLGQARGFTLLAVLTLALGVGATIAVFAVADAVLLRPLPYGDPGRLAAFAMREARGGPHPSSLSYPTFFDLRAANRVFEHMVSYRDATFISSSPSPALQVPGEIVSWDLFPMLQIDPILGRGFRPGEERPGNNVAVISYAFWQSRFGGSRDVLRRPVEIDGKLFNIVGVAPPRFHFPPDNVDAQLWTTLAQDATAGEYHPLTVQRGARAINVMARLKPGVAAAQARAQMDVAARALAKQYPDDNGSIPATYVEPALAVMTDDARKPIWILLGAVGLLLLIACANVANLLLTRSAERGREFALRVALGASRSALVRQLIVESLVLGAMGSAVGVGLALAVLKLMLPLAGTSVPRIAEAGVDARVAAFSMALALLTSCLSSLAPAFQLVRADLAAALKTAGRALSFGHHRLRGALVIAQMMLGLMLLSGAQLLIASFLHLEHRDPGFRPDHLLTFQISLPDSQYKVARQIVFSDRMLDELSRIPGVESAATGMPLPLAGNQMSVSFDLADRPLAPSRRPSADIAIVSPGYFDTLGIAFFKGRRFSERDNAQSPRVLIVNQAFAEKFFPGENPVGKRIMPGATNGDSQESLCEIVGLVANAKQTPLKPEPDPIYYFPYKQLSWGIGSVVLRTSVPPLTVAKAARDAIGRLDKQVPVYDVSSMDAIASEAVAPPRFLTLLMTGFSAIALLLTAIGLYGVLAFSVARRRRELGIRVALGALRTDVVGLVLRQALLLVAGGTVLGVAGSFAGSRLLSSVLYDTRARNPLLLALASVVLVLTSLVAAFVPARRAASVDPAEALRSE